MPASLAGAFPVDESAQLLRYYRYAVERMMRALGGWIALTPELSAKLLLGRHVWDAAQHCDAMGKRLLELRSQAQTSGPASPGVVAFMDELEGPEGRDQTVERLAGVYRVLKPHLVGTYEWHLARANPVYEPPTRRLLARCIEDERRHLGAGETVLRHLAADPARQARAAAWQGHLEERLARVGGVAARGLPPAAAPPEGPDAEAAEFVRLEESAGPRGVPPSLLAAVATLGDAIVSGDRARVDSWFAADALRPEMVPLGLLASHRLVALARVGRQYMAKVRLAGPAGPTVLLTRWVSADGQWRIAAAEVARVEAAGSA